MTKFVIVGAGVIGLYTAFELLQHGISGNELSVIAEFSPGDESINYPSMAAGANHSLMSGEDDNMLKFEKYNYLNMHKIQQAIGGKEKGIDRYKSTEYWEIKPSSMKKIDSVKSYFEEYEEIPVSKLPDGAEFGISFLSWNFNAPKFLFNLYKHLQSQGVSFTRKKLSHIIQAYSDDTKYVFNCTGLGAKDLIGDKLMYPARGQVVVVKAPHIKENVMLWSKYKPPTYIIKRPFSNDQLILGGFYQKDDYRSDNYKAENDDVLKRTTKLFPKILNGKSIEDLEVLKNVTGFRPGRYGGVRIEKERFDEGKILIHNYGAGGYGYQAGYGMAHYAVDLALNESKL
ncbi:unnamed protein product [Candida verbasci]|uniref:FAD dependent oxidoreductase domain-containing protein n=1 Tax=Candida verbasci TaxID=1227364 RepID=A0A9W4XN33_9ASCO|nr:unnamed protein product [Candida verbasci]